LRTKATEFFLNDQREDRKKIKDERGNRRKEGEGKKEEMFTCSAVLVRRRFKCPSRTFRGGSLYNSIVLQVAIDMHSPLWACILSLPIAVAWK
jgi:hypothetical protein